MRRNEARPEGLEEARSTYASVSSAQELSAAQQIGGLRDRYPSSGPTLFLWLWGWGLQDFKAQVVFGLAGASSECWGWQGRGDRLHSLLNSALYACHKPGALKPDSLALGRLQLERGLTHRKASKHPCIRLNNCSRSKTAHC